MAKENEETTLETEESQTTETTESEAKVKKERKVVRRRKSKKDKESPLIGAIRLAVESGKVDFGAKVAAKKKAKLFVICSNTPAPILAKVSAAASKGSVSVLDFDGTSMELGSVCGRPYPVTVLSIYDAGSSNILEMAKKK
jgi:large subunit ribosomal protein L30e